MNTQKYDKNTDRVRISRRKLLKALTATGGAFAASTLLPSKWTSPAVSSGVLPVHAQGSPVATPDPVSGTPEPPLGFKYAVLATGTGQGTGTEEVVVFPTANVDLPNPEQFIVPGLPSDRAPHGISYFGTASALVADFRKSRIYVIDLVNRSLVDTILTSSYDGTGTIAVAPGSTHALAAGENSSLSVFTAPFTSASAEQVIALPGVIETYQTQAIVFNSAGRAYVYHTGGISVLDRPYTSISFTVPFNNSGSGAIAITPDGSQLLTTDLSSEKVFVFNGPLQTDTIPEEIIIDVTPTSSTIEAYGGAGTLIPFSQQVFPSLDGIQVAPNGEKALVVSSQSSVGFVFVISAPFGAGSTIENIPLPGSARGFEDIGMSSDGGCAILTGNDLGAGGELAFIIGPFSASSAVYSVPVIPGSRGAGGVRFQPPNVV